MLIERTEVLERLRTTVESGEPIIAAGAGNGIAAKWAKKGGADLIFIYNTGRFRMEGRSSLSGLMPFGDANEMTMDMARDVVPLLPDTPVIAGLCGTDPYRHMPVFLEEVKRKGPVGVMNWPSVGLIDGVFRENLEGSGIKWEQEVDMVRVASDLGMVTAPFAYGPETTREMVEAGADIVVTHMGLTTTGDVGAEEAVTLDDAVEEVQAIADAAKEGNEDAFVLAHGGPMSDPDDVEYVLERTAGVEGFLGGSAIERIPTEKAIKERVEAYKAIEPGA